MSDWICAIKTCFLPQEMREKGCFNSNEGILFHHRFVESSVQQLFLISLANRQMEIKYSEKAVKQIRKIHKGDRKSLDLILNAVESYAANSNPLKKFDVKSLTGKYGNFKRLRAGDYRVIFEESKNIISIYEIKHRQEVYHD